MRAKRQSAILCAAAIAALVVNGRMGRTAVTWTGTGGVSWSSTTSWNVAAGPGTTDTAIFNDAGSTNLPAETTSILNANRTIGGLSFSDTTGKFHTLDLGTHNLIVTGNVNFNLDQSSATTTTLRDGTLTLSGSFATLNVGEAVSASAVSTVDFSGLTQVTGTLQSVFVGTSTSGSATGSLTLSPSNTITANLIQVGASNLSSDTNGTLNLGLNNTISTPEFDIGKDNSNALVGIVSGGTLNLGTTAQMTLLQVANQNYNNQYGSYTAQLNLGNAAVNLHLSSLIVGEKNGGSGQTTGIVQGGGSGSVVVGASATPGNIYVGYSVYDGTAQGTVDFSRLTTMQAYLTDFLVGDVVSGTASGTVSLAATTTINAANSIVIGSNRSATLTLGRTANTLLTNQLTIGQSASNSLVQIASGSSLVLGSASQRTSVSIGSGNFNNSYGSYVSEMNLAGATFTGYLSNLIVGQKDGGAGNSSGTLLGGNSGSVNIGATGNSANFYVGNVINGGGATGVVDFSGLATLTANLNTLSVGTAISGTATGTLKLAVTNNIIANNIVIGDNAATSNITTNSLILGSSNSILTNQLSIGLDYSNGLVQIASGGTLNLGSAAQRANLSIATANTNDPYNTYGGTLDLTNATIVAYLNNVIIGNKNALPGTELGAFTISGNSNNYVNANTVLLGGTKSTGIINYGGGQFFAGSITAGPGTAAFNWTGGKLSVGTFGMSTALFNLSNQGTGTLAPASASGAIGTTTIYGNYTQGAQATTAIRIAGASPSAGNDQVNVVGTAALSGTLNLSLINGFVPSVGQQFLIETYASASDYALIDNAYQKQSGSLANGMIAEHAAEFGAPYTEALAALNTSAVPEPGSLTILGVGMIGLVRRRRPRN